MTTKYFSAGGLIAAVLVGLSFPMFAQEKRPTQPPAAPQTTISSQDKAKPKVESPKAISAADKAAIKEIFKDVDPSQYRLEFNGGKETMGSKKISMDQVRQVQKVRNPSEAPALVTFVVADRGVMYIYTATLKNRVLEGVLGKEKTARLDRIMAKYTQ